MHYMYCDKMEKMRKNEYAVVRDEEVTEYIKPVPLKIELNDDEIQFLLKEIAGEGTLSDLFEDQVKINEKCRISIIRKLKNE